MSEHPLIMKDEFRPDIHTWLTSAAEIGAADYVKWKQL
jgi:hypothetical protein